MLSNPTTVGCKAEVTDAAEAGLAASFSFETLLEWLIASTSHRYVPVIEHLPPLTGEASFEPNERIPPC